MPKSAYLKLSALTFFQFVVFGATTPMMGTYLKDTLGFSGAQVGIALTLSQLSSMSAPLVTAFIVDRVVPTRTLFLALHLGSALASLLLAGQTQFWAFLPLFIVFSFFMGPTGGLVNALIFARLPAGGQYGRVRLWGTIGWVAVAGVLALLWLVPGSTVSWMFWVAAAGSLVTAVTALLLPQVPTVRPVGRFRLFPREALKVFFQSNILKIGAVYFVSGILDRFYLIATAPYLKQLGFTDSLLMPAMTLGQVTEAVLLLLTGPVLKRWGLRNTLLVGLGFQFVRFALMLTNPGPGWLLLALSLNGFVFAFFYAVVTIYVDGHTDAGTRGTVHQLLTLVISGTSAVVGSLVAGLAFDWFGRAGKVDYFWYWSIPLVLSVVALALVLALFSRREKPDEAAPVA